MFKLIVKRSDTLKLSLQIILQIRLEQSIINVTLIDLQVNMWYKSQLFFSDLWFFEWAKKKTFQNDSARAECRFGVIRSRCLL